MSADISSTSLLIYDHPGSSYCQKVRIALREKGIPFQTQLPMGLASGSGSTLDQIATANPRTQVPTLVDGDFNVFDSTIILEYIEDKWPEPALRPRDPAGRARARMIEDIADTVYEAANWGWLEVNIFGRAENVLAQKLNTQIAAQTKVIHQWLTEKLGSRPWFNGEHFGWADIAVAPFIHTSVSIGLGPAEGSALENWYSRSKSRPSVAETFAERDASFKELPKLAGFFKTSGRQREYRDHRLEWMIKSGGIDVVLEGLRNQNIRFSWPDTLHGN